MSSAPYTLAWSFLRAAKRLQAQGYDFDLIDAHLAFPGCEGDSLLMLLDARGIECSTGSAWPT